MLKLDYMKITYDKKANTVYIYVNRDKIARTIEIGKDFLVDLSKRGQIVGLEILQASKNLGGLKNKPAIVIGNKPVLLIP